MGDVKWQQLTEVISSPWSDQAEVWNAYNEAFTLLYGGGKGSKYIKLRWLLCFQQRYLILLKDGKLRNLVIDCFTTILGIASTLIWLATIWYRQKNLHQMEETSMIYGHIINGFELDAIKWVWKLHDEQRYCTRSTDKGHQCNCKLRFLLII